MRWMLLALAVGCATPRRGPTMATPAALDEKAKRGEIVYMQNCQQCHPNGEGGMGPSMNNRHLPGFAIKAQTRLGAGAMPAFSKDEISHDELDAMVDYMREIRRVRPEEDTEASTKGDRK